MLQSVKGSFEELSQFSSEMEVYARYRDSLVRSLRKLDSGYRNGRYGYLDYENRQKLLLKGKTEAEWVQHYNTYILSLLKRMEMLTAELFKTAYEDVSYESIGKEEEEEEAKEEAEAKSETRAAARALPASERQASYAVIPAKIRPAEVIVRKPLAVPSAADREADREPAAAFRPEEDERIREIDTRIRSVRERLGAMAEKKERDRLARLAQAQASPPVYARLLSAAAGMMQRIAAGLRKIPGRVSGSLSALARKVPVPRLPGVPVLSAFLSAWKSVAALPGKAAASVAALAGKVWRKPASARPPHLPEKKPARAALPGPAIKLPAWKLKVPGLERLGLDRLFRRPSGGKEPTIFIEEIVSMEKSPEEKEQISRHGKGITIGLFPGKLLFEDLLRRLGQKQEPVLSEDTVVPVYARKLRELRKRLYEAEALAGFEATLLAEEAKRIRKLLEVERAELQRGKSLALIANIMVKKVSLSLVERFPEFFESFYNALRAANLKMLSNTYLNIAVLVTMFLSGIVWLLGLVLFFTLNYPLYQIFLRATIFALVAGALGAAFFFMYPFSRINSRRSNITSNLPFAASHMASVATSGVAPVRMFELIAESGEYGEIAVECRKLVDFINLFGYDLLTAINAVAATTPSPQFKEFLEGMVSTIETGGDLDNYLKQKAEEAAFAYQLERQQYNNIVSTYSDVYTGILIAAPLFFMAALSLVNILGGSVGGITISALMSMGAYLVIPLLNIGFIVFLQLTQPEV